MLATSVPALAAQAKASTGERVLVLGDSLSAEYGIARGSGWVELVRARTSAPITNASVSGETSSGGRTRLPALLAQHKPTLVVIELGANDALRGLPLAALEANLRAMAQAAKGAGARVLLVGIQVPPNYGAAYTRDFAATFQRVARSERAALVPQLLAGVADAPDAARWFQDDRVHPNAAAQPRLADTVWQVLGPMLR